MDESCDCRQARPICAPCLIEYEKIRPNGVLFCKLQNVIRVKREADFGRYPFPLTALSSYQHIFVNKNGAAIIGARRNNGIAVSEPPCIDQFDACLDIPHFDLDQAAQSFCH